MLRFYKSIIVVFMLFYGTASYGLADASAPTKIQIPFANGAGGAYVRTIPISSQIGIQSGAASYTDGFPPLNFTPVSAGGVPPFGQDMNGILRDVSAHARWWAAGGPVYYDGTYQTAIGGYPKGACVQSATTTARIWCSTVDNNTTNPDTGGANWQYLNDAANATYAVNLTGTIASGVFAITQINSDSSSKVATTAFVHNYAVGIGSNHIVTGSRALGVTYNAAAGSAIFLSVSGYANGSGCTLSIINNGTTIANWTSYTTSGTNYFFLSGIISPGALYSVTQSASCAAVNVWNEWY